MAWTTPRTWATDELVTATIMNTYIRDNQTELKNPPTDMINIDEGADYTTTSASFADVDSAGDPDLSLTITTSGGDVLIGFIGCISHSLSTGQANFELDIDGSPAAGDDGIFAVRVGATTDRYLVSFPYLIQGLSAGSHTIKLQWKTNSGTITMYAGAGTSLLDVHPHMWFREVS